jgi:hypothetical protein
LLKSAPSRKEVTFFGRFSRELEAEKIRPAKFSRVDNRLKNSGDEGDRTLNPWLAKPVLSQLSYVPNPSSARHKIRTCDLVVISDAL